MIDASNPEIAWAVLKKLFIEYMNSARVFFLCTRCLFEISVTVESANDSVGDETLCEMQHNSAAALSFRPNTTDW